MFFQFSPPARQPPRRKIPKKVEENDSAVLTLAPFNPAPKIFFENVKIGESSVQKLVVRNPRLHPVTIFTELKLSEETNLQLNFSTKDIVANGEDVVTLTWTPTTVGSWRHILHVTDGDRFSTDVPIALKSVSPVKKAKVPLKKNSLPRYVAKKTSPVQKHRRTSPQKKILPNITNLPFVKISSPEVTMSFGGKENLPNFSPSFIENDRRETYVVGQNIKEIAFDDSLEKSPNISFEVRLKSESFTLASVGTTPTNSEFNPGHCSTEEKSVTAEFTFAGQKIAVFAEQNTTYSLENDNASNETYTKTNTSGETFVLNNLSSETYVKNNLSPDAYANDISHFDLNIRVTPPSYSQQARLDSLSGSSVKEAIGANFWSNTRPKRQLSLIREEPQSFDIKPTPVKRKSDLTFNTVSPKRLNLGQSHITDWSKSKSASVIDPETTSWLEKQEGLFKRWLNGVLTPPSDLIVNEHAPFDIAKLWRQCQKQEVKQEEENVGDMLTNTKLNSLRRSAKIFYNSDEIQEVLSKVWGAIDNERLSVRSDRDIHLDLALQAEIMSILFSYNPLWLRLGLETVYNRILPLRNNSDIIGLTTFLSTRFIRDPFLLKRFKSIHSQKYAIQIKKFILKKFLALIYFLDCAKMSKLIPHDPCLFCKNAPLKESRDALLRFSRDILSSMGDVTKYLRNFKYVVQHKQTYLDEFDYAVNCLGTDLRDGVRLTRVMEVILLENDLSKQLRVPAISRLQKKHNVKLVFEVIRRHNFEIKYEITPKDIVDGHKEKTLSFLWQIIYKFNTPLMSKSVTVITTWWRSAAVVAKRQELRAARKIQIWYRRKRRKLETVRNRSATAIQGCVRMFLARRRFLKLKYCVSLVETTYLANKARRIERERFETLKNSTIVIQRRWRAQLAMRTAMIRYQAQRDAAVAIQRKWRATLAAMREREDFLRLKHFTILVQQKRRAKMVMQVQMEEYQILKATVIMIQRRFRANNAMRIERTNFEALKRATVVIQQKVRAKLRMKIDYNHFQKLKSNVIFVQRKWKAKLATRQEMRRYHTLLYSTIVIQRRFRANVATRLEYAKFQKLKNVTVLIQRKYRAKLLERQQRREFQELKNAAIIIQRRWRANLAMKRELKRFQAVKKAILTIQIRHRAYKTARREFEYFQKLKKATVFVQTKWRAILAMRKEVRDYHTLRSATLLIQRQYRANVATRSEYENFKNLKKVTIFIQRKWRAKLSMRKEVENYRSVRNAVLVIQSKYRAYMAAKLEFTNFQKLKTATIFTQRKWRAKLAMRKDTVRYRVLREWTIIVQRRFRANMDAKLQFENFQKLKNTAMFVQRKWRAKLAMLKEVESYRSLRNAAIVVQNRYRAKVAAKLEYDNFQTLRNAIVFIQRKWRAKLAMRREVKNYQSLRNAAGVIQRRFRANLQMKLYRQKFSQLKDTVIIIQRRWRATLEMKIQMKVFQEMMEQYRNVHLIITRIQSCSRGFLVRRKYAEYFTDDAKEARRLLRIRNKAATKIQARWRGYKIRSTQKPKMVEICERLKIANRSANPDNTLGARCKKAIKELPNTELIRDILRVLEDLEFITRRDKESCSKMADILPEHLYKTIISTNRSPPEIQVCTAAVSILINFYRFKPTRTKSWRSEYMEKIVTIALHFCDNDSALFPTLCTLLWFFLQNDDYKTVIVSSSRFKEKMSQIREKCERKKKMISKMNVKYISFFAHFNKDLPLPSEVPDWGLEHKHKPKVFTNSVFALNCILSLVKF